MLILQLLIVPTLGEIESLGRNSTECNGLLFHDVYYDSELLFKQFEKPYNLVIHKYSGALFFSHTFMAIEQNTTYTDFKISFCFLDERDCKDVNGIQGGYAIAYDKGNDDLYLGGHDGIYKYNFLTNDAEFFTEMGVSIWGLFVKKNFYYIEYPTQTLRIYQNGVFIPVAEAIGVEVDNFLISKHGHVYFSNRTAVYKQEKNGKEIIHLSDSIVVRQIVEDSYGEVYFVAKDGIHWEEKPKRYLTRIATIDDVYGMAFDDKGRVIYSDNNSIYRLIPKPEKKICYPVISELNEESTKKFDTILEYAKELMFEYQLK